MWTGEGEREREREREREGESGERGKVSQTRAIPLVRVKVLRV
jgi:hypothetical protein